MWKQIPGAQEGQESVVASGYKNLPMAFTLKKKKLSELEEFRSTSLPSLNKTSFPYWLPRIYPYAFFGISGNKVSVKKSVLLEYTCLLICIMCYLCS